MGLIQSERITDPNHTDPMNWCFVGAKIANLIQTDCDIRRYIEVLKRWQQLKN